MEKPNKFSPKVRGCALKMERERRGTPASLQPVLLAMRDWGVAYAEEQLHEAQGQSVSPRLSACPPPSREGVSESHSPCRADTP